MNHVALIYQAQTDAPAQRRRNLAIQQLQFLIINLSLVRPHSALELPYGRVLSVHLLLPDYAFLVQLVEAREFNPCIVELGLIPRQLPLHLLERHLKWARIDLRKKVAFADKLAFLEVDLLELAIDSGFHR